MKSVYVALTLIALATTTAQASDKLICYGHFTGQTDEDGVQLRVSDMSPAQRARSRHTFLGDIPGCTFEWTDGVQVKGITKLYSACRLGEGCTVYLRRARGRVEITDALVANDQD